MNGETWIAGEREAGGRSGGVSNVEMVMFVNAHHCLVGEPGVVRYENVLEASRHLQRIWPNST